VEEAVTALVTTLVVVFLATAGILLWTAVSYARRCNDLAGQDAVLCATVTAQSRELVALAAEIAKLCDERKVMCDLDNAQQERLFHLRRLADARARQVGVLVRQRDAARAQNVRLRGWMRRAMDAGSAVAATHLVKYIGEMDAETCLLAEQLGKTNHIDSPEEGTK
jgi:hypothetical protein